LGGNIQEKSKKKIYNDLIISQVFLCLLYFTIMCQIDKLQTNHKGIFVLSDLKFKWLEKYCSDDTIAKQNAARLLHFPCGILRGALANLGILSIVTADFTSLPACVFNIRVKT
jgi:hypothetical protein